MKKVLCLILATVLCLGLVGCGAVEKVEEMKEVADEISSVVEEIDGKVEEIEDVQENGFEFEPLKYKMAKIGTSEVDGKHVFAFVVEIPAIKNENITYSLHVMNADGTDHYEDDSLSRYSNTYESAIATKEELEEIKEKFKKVEEQAIRDNDEEALEYGHEFPWFLMNYEADQLWTCILTSDNPISEDDFSVKFKRDYFYGDAASEEIFLEFNAEIEEVNMSPAYTDGNTLLNLNGTYVILNPGNDGRGGNVVGTREYKGRSFIEVLNPFKNEKDLSKYEGLKFDWYFGLDKIEVPEGFEDYIEIENDNGQIKMWIGFEASDEYKVESGEESELEKFISKNNPALVTPDGDVVLN